MGSAWEGDRLGLGGGLWSQPFVGQPQNCPHQPGSTCPTGTCIMTDSSKVAVTQGCHYL